MMTDKLSYQSLLNVLIAKKIAKSSLLITVLLLSGCQSMQLAQSPIPVVAPSNSSVN